MTTHGILCAARAEKTIEMVIADTTHQNRSGYSGRSCQRTCLTRPAYRSTFAVELITCTIHSFHVTATNPNTPSRARHTRTANSKGTMFSTTGRREALWARGNAPFQTVQQLLCLRSRQTDHDRDGCSSFPSKSTYGFRGPVSHVNILSFPQHALDRPYVGLSPSLALIIRQREICNFSG